MYRQCGLCDNRAVTTIADVRLCETCVVKVCQIATSAIKPERERETAA
jgi:hypothetical protein